jgi:hypothetical protein
MYYFRLVEPDFTPLPVYKALKDYLHSAEAQILYPGVHQEDHWALFYQGSWEEQSESAAELGSYQQALDPEAAVTFTFHGTDLRLLTGPERGGTVTYVLDGQEEETVSFAAGEEIELAQGLRRGEHNISLYAKPDLLSLDSVTVLRPDPMMPWLVMAGAILAGGLIMAVIAGAIVRRRRWYDRSRA